MSLDKSIKKGKEHRKPYYRMCYIVDYSCRNHGGKTKRKSGGQCQWCLENRTHKYIKEIMRSEASFEEYNGGR